MMMIQMAIMMLLTLLMRGREGMIIMATGIMQETIMLPLPRGTTMQTEHHSADP